MSSRVGTSPRITFAKIASSSSFEALLYKISPKLISLALHPFATKNSIRCSKALTKLSNERTSTPVTSCSLVTKLAKFGCDTKASSGRNVGATTVSKAVSSAIF